MSRRWVLAVVCALGGCPAGAPPYGQVRVSIESDLSVPRLLARLRVDVLGDDGGVLATMDASVREARALPATFTVWTPGDRATVWVRVRGVPDGAVLGRDEPDPSLAVDALTRVELRDGVLGEATIALRGACSGVPSDVEGRRTCGADGALAPVAGATPSGLVPGTFGATAAPLPAPRGPSADDEGEVVVLGGAFVLGDRTVATGRVWGGVAVSSAPPRLVRVGALLVDVHEVTVGRFRRALAAGFSPPTLPTAHEAPLPTTGTGTVDLTACTWSAAPRGREAHPLVCVDHATARAFCAHASGDLPTEAEWEWIATAEGRPQKTAFPFGDTRPTCDQAVFARVGGGVFELAECTRAGAPFGPAPVLSAPLDRTPAGVVGLGGNVAEWTLDAYASYDACPVATGRVDPRCDVPGAARRVTRGGAFTEGWSGALAALRKPGDPALPFPGIGFRCVRRGP